MIRERLQHEQGDRRSDPYADLEPSDDPPAWLRRLHHDTTASGSPALQSRRAGSGVLTITEPNELSARPGVLKSATSAKRQRNLLHEARVLALVARSCPQAQGLTPRLLGLWRVGPPDTLYILTTTLPGTPLADLPDVRTPELRSEISRLIDALHSLERPVGLTNEGVDIECWQKHASAELTRYADLLVSHGYTAAANILRRFREVPIDQSGGHRLVHRDLSRSNLIIDHRCGHVAVRACDFASSFFAPRLWDLAGAELFLFPTRPDLRAPLRSQFEQIAGDRCAKQTLCLAIWQVCRLYAAAHRRADATATRRIAHALSTADIGRGPQVTACYRRAAMLGDQLRCP